MKFAIYDLAAVIEPNLAGLPLQQGRHATLNNQSQRKGFQHVHAIEVTALQSKSVNKWSYCDPPRDI